MDFYSFKLLWSVFWYMQVSSMLTDEHHEYSICYFPTPVVTKHRKLRCLKTTKMYFCPYPGVQSPKSRNQQGCFLTPRGSEGESVPCFLPGVYWLPVTLDIAWLVYVLLLCPRWSPYDPPLSFYVLSFSVSHKDTSHWMSGPPQSRMISSRDPYLIFICKDSYSK